MNELQELSTIKILIFISATTMAICAIAVCYWLSSTKSLLEKICVLLEKDKN